MFFVGSGFVVFVRVSRACFALRWWLMVRCTRGGDCFTSSGRFHDDAHHGGPLMFVWWSFSRVIVGHQWGCKTSLRYFALLFNFITTCVPDNFSLLTIF